jgi:hypothetical protein
MGNYENVDRIYKCLVDAPTGNCLVTEVLAAAGMFVSAILNKYYEDQAERLDGVDRFCATLRACVDPAFRAKLVQQSRQPTLN